MGRILLSALPLLALLAACEAPARPGGGAAGAERRGSAAESVARPVTLARETASAEDAHEDVACAGCHNGPRADLGRASAPREGCTASGCHEDAGPERVRFATVEFEHRRHGEGGEIEPSCAGCHTHPDGETPLRTSVDACALCHLSELTSESPQDCQLCHREPQHVTLTSAGLPVPHANLPWAEIGCVRCHYDVADPQAEVDPRRCADCHRDVAAVTRQGIGADLHPRHAGVNCVACHEAGSHHVRALSSAVSLACADCHATSHELRLAGWGGSAQQVWEESATCVGCHTTVHRAQQQLLLGLVPGGPAMASSKFVTGVTCRSCHIPPAGGALPQRPIRGQARACAACHEPEYGDVLGMWLDGLQSRLRASRAYVQAAQQALGAAAPDSARQLLTSAAQMLAIVEEAGGQHNLELSDRVFRESVTRAQQAYRVAGRAAPPPPDLGRSPHLGLCSGCHYGEDDLDLRAMPEALHRRFLEAQQLPAPGTQR